MRRRNPLYFVLTAMFFLSALIGGVIMAVVLSGGGRETGSEGLDIMKRAGAVIGQDERASDLSRLRVDSGIFSVSDYVSSVLTSPQYLVRDVDDNTFATDLSNIALGRTDSETVSAIVEKLKSSNRMYVIDETLKGIDRSYRSAGSIPSSAGTNFSTASVNTGFDNVDGYTIGIKNAEGKAQISGKELRTDFIVDNTLYRASLKLGDKDPDGNQNFTMAWDTAGVAPGVHNAYVLVRSSDGRGKVVTGGEVKIPEFGKLEKGGASKGKLNAVDDTSWFILDAKKDDLYVNFVGLSDDIKVSLYDVYGNLVGSNDLPGKSIEMLRGHKQDTKKISQETGIGGVSNAFYIKVDRGSEFAIPELSTDFVMVQTPEVASYSGQYMAVKTDITDAGPDTEILLKDADGNEYKALYSDIKILPVNGYLSSMNFSDPASGSAVKVWPEFGKEDMTYAYRFAGSRKFAVNAVPQEGYSASVDVLLNGSPVESPESIEIPEGESELVLNVKAFSGTEREYKIWFLNGNDGEGFAENVLGKFPESYGSGLYLLHKLQPAYLFEPVDTGLDYQTVLKHEDSGSKSLLEYSSFPDYIKNGSPVYDKPDWMAAKTEVVDYFLDPRNFFLEDRVFMFEQLSFNEKVHNIDGVKAILKGSFMEDGDQDYAKLIFEAGQEAGVSPYFLASRILQEMGVNGESKLSHGTVEGYEGYYNFYNIGASASTDKGGAVLKGAKYAKWGKDADSQTIDDSESAMLLPWDSPEKAIKGGAKWIAKGYIDCGQDTLYQQKFDVIDNGTDLYEHQYAQNIMMAYSESARYYKSYKSIDRLGSGFVFRIPVYADMPITFGKLPEG